MFFHETLYKLRGRRAPCKGQFPRIAALLPATSYVFKEVSHMKKSETPVRISAAGSAALSQRHGKTLGQRILDNWQLYAPHFISVMVICGMIKIFLSPTGGLLNLLLGTQIDFLTQSEAFRTIYIASGIWQDAGWGCIIYLATLANVDPGLYEAAKMDGASVFQRILNIDIPELLPMAILNLIMAAGGIMNVGFEKVWLLQTDLNKATSDVIAVYVYQQGIEQAKYSYSTAVGLFNTAINIVLLIIVNKIASKASDVQFV